MRSFLVFVLVFVLLWSGRPIAVRLRGLPFGPGLALRLRSLLFGLGLALRLRSRLFGLGVVLRLLRPRLVDRHPVHRVLLRLPRRSIRSRLGPATVDPVLELGMSSAERGPCRVRAPGFATIGDPGSLTLAGAKVRAPAGPPDAFVSSFCRC